MRRPQPVDLPPRRSDNDKRRLVEDPPPVLLERLESAVNYAGSSKHKRHPHLYNLPPFKGKRGDATLCDGWRHRSETEPFNDRKVSHPRPLAGSLVLYERPERSEGGLAEDGSDSCYSAPSAGGGPQPALGGPRAPRRSAAGHATTVAQPTQGSRSTYQRGSPARSACVPAKSRRQWLGRLRLHRLPQSSQIPLVRVHILADWMPHPIHSVEPVLHPPASLYQLGNCEHEL